MRLPLAQRATTSEKRTALDRRLNAVFTEVKGGPGCYARGLVCKGYQWLVVGVQLDNRSIADVRPMSLFVSDRAGRAVSPGTFEEAEWDRFAVTRSKSSPKFGKPKTNQVQAVAVLVPELATLDDLVLAMQSTPPQPMWLAYDLKRQ